jgi:hypothetical protein
MIDKNTITAQLQGLDFEICFLKEYTGLHIGQILDIFEGKNPRTLAQIKRDNLKAEAEARREAKREIEIELYYNQ